MTLPIGKHPDVAAQRDAVELAEWMSNAGHEMLPVDTKDERSALIDAYFESLRVDED